MLDGFTWGVIVGCLATLVVNILRLWLLLCKPERCDLCGATVTEEMHRRVYKIRGVAGTPDWEKMIVLCHACYEDERTER